MTTKEGKGLQSYSIDFLVNWLADLVAVTPSIHAKWITSSALHDLFKVSTDGVIMDCPNLKGFNTNLGQIHRKKQLNIHTKKENSRAKTRLYLLLKESDSFETQDNYEFYSRPLRNTTRLQNRIQGDDTTKMPSHALPPPSKKQRTSMQNYDDSCRRRSSNNQTPTTFALQSPPPQQNLQGGTSYTSHHAVIPTPVNANLNKYIQSSVKLNFDIYPRPDFRQNNHPTIPIRSESNVNKTMKWHMIAVANGFGYGKMALKEKKVLAEAITKREAYLAGYKKWPSCHSFSRWWDEYTKARHNSVRIDELFDTKQTNHRFTYVSYLVKKFPTFLHSLYRYAIKTAGPDATTDCLINIMNCKSAVDHPHCPIRSNLKFSKSHFWNFFNTYGGKMKAPITKPRLTPDHKEQRIKFSEKWLDRLEMQKLKKKGKGGRFHYCFLDEKWIYTTSRRRKLKVLPPADFEDAEEVRVTNPKVRSRRHPCKIMYMGIVAPPKP